jgi:hypothetical protein
MTGRQPTAAVHVETPSHRAHVRTHRTKRHDAPSGGGALHICTRPWCKVKRSWARVVDRRPMLWQHVITSYGGRWTGTEHIGRAQRRLTMEDLQVL